MACLCVRTTAFWSFNIVKPYLDVSVSPWDNVPHSDLCRTLTFDLNIKIIFSPWIYVCARSSLLFDIGITNLTGCITMRCYVYSWPLYDLDLWVLNVWGFLQNLILFIIDYNTLHWFMSQSTDLHESLKFCFYVLVCKRFSTNSSVLD